MLLKAFLKYLISVIQLLNLKKVICHVSNIMISYIPMPAEMWILTDACGARSLSRSVLDGI